MRIQKGQKARVVAELTHNVDLVAEPLPAITLLARKYLQRDFVEPLPCGAPHDTIAAAAQRRDQRPAINLVALL